MKQEIDAYATFSTEKYFSQLLKLFYFSPSVTWHIPRGIYKGLLLQHHFFEWERQCNFNLENHSAQANFTTSPNPELGGDFLIPSGWGPLIVS